MRLCFVFHFADCSFIIIVVVPICVFCSLAIFTKVCKIHRNNFLYCTIAARKKKEFTTNLWSEKNIFFVGCLYIPMFDKLRTKKYTWIDFVSWCAGKLQTSNNARSYKLLLVEGDDFFTNKIIYVVLLYWFWTYENFCHILIALPRVSKS